MPFCYIIFLAPDVAPPTKLEIVVEIPVGSYCYSVCESRAVSYVGVEGGLEIISGDTNSSNRLISLDGYIHSVCSYKDRLYLLHWASDKWSVLVYDTNGRGQLLKWLHNDITNSYPNKLAIYNQHIYVPDRSRNRITVYTLDGVIVTHYDCKLDSDITALTVTSSGQIVISQLNSGLLRCISVVTSQELWTTKLVEPSAVTTDKKHGFIYVATGGLSETLDMKILKPNKGIIIHRY